MMSRRTDADPHFAPGQGIDVACAITREGLPASQPQPMVMVVTGYGQLVRMVGCARGSAYVPDYHDARLHLDGLQTGFSRHALMASSGLIQTRAGVAPHG